MKTAFFLSLLAARLAAQSASVEGTVLDRITRKPIPGVHLTLLIAGDSFSAEAASGAISDSSGRFTIGRMPPGRYDAILRRTGYLQTGDNANLTLKEGQQLAGITFEMLPASMLTGRVLDEDGDPVAGAPIELIATEPGKLSRLARDWRDKETDERGEFRFLAAPGKYYLKAGPGVRFRDQGVAEIRSDGTAEKVYTPTFYPSAATKARAQIIEVKAGRDTADIEIRLRGPASQRPLSVSGTIEGVPPGGTTQVLAVRTDGPRFETPPVFTQAHADGKFVFNALTPGSYDILAEGNASGQPPNSDQAGNARVPIVLDTVDVTGIRLELRPPVELTGTLTTTGGTANEKWTLRLERAVRGFFFQDEDHAATVAKDGSFRFSKIRPGSFQLTLDPKPDSAYLKTVELNGAAVKNGAIEWMGGGIPILKVVVGLDGGVISGKVLDQAGDVAPGFPAVYLMSGPRDVAASESELEQGQYRLRGIRPGRYRLVVLEDNVEPFRVDPDAQSEALEQRFDATEEFEITAGQRLTRDIKLKPKEEGNGKLP